MINTYEGNFTGIDLEETEFSMVEYARLIRAQLFLAKENKQHELVSCLEEGARVGAALIRMGEL